VNLDVTHKIGHSFRERNHSEEKVILPKFQRMAVERMETCEDVGDLGRELGYDRGACTSGGAIKVPLAELAETKEKVRSALNRATRKEGRKVATATDDRYLYIWNLGE